MKLLISKHNLDDILTKAIDAVDKSDILYNLAQARMSYMTHADIVKLVTYSAIDYVFQYGLARKRHKKFQQHTVILYNLDDLVSEIVGEVYNIENIHQAHGYVRELDIRGSNLFIIWSKE